jgi:DNA mismatch repair ATPase MutS
MIKNKSTILDILNVNDIQLLIKPFSELGIFEQNNFTSFQSDDIIKANEYYKNISIIQTLIKKDQSFIRKVGGILHNFENIQKIINNKNKLFDIHEIYEIKHFIFHYICLFKILDNYKIELIPKRNFVDLFNFLDIEQQNTSSFHISSLYSESFSQLKTELNKLEKKKDELFNNHKKEIIKKLNLINLEETTVISKLNKDKINLIENSNYFYISQENFANISYTIKKTEAIFEIETKEQLLKIEVQKEVENILENISNHIFNEKENLKNALIEIGYFDLIFAKAIYAKNHSCIVPTILPKGHETKFNGKKICDIVLKKEIEKKNNSYQSINLHISKNTNIITGSNMGGKSSVLKLVGQISCLVKFGVPIPAEEMEIQLFDNVFYDGSTKHEQSFDFSTFALEIISLQKVIEAKGYNLYLLDEFARGTNPFEGQALFESVIGYFSKKNNTILLAATHYNTPKDELLFQHFQLPGLKSDFFSNVNDSFSIEEKLKLLNKYINFQPIVVSSNETTKSSAILISEFLGLEKEIIKKIKF